MYVHLTIAAAYIMSHQKFPHWAIPREASLLKNRIPRQVSIAFHSRGGQPTRDDRASQNSSTHESVTQLLVDQRNCFIGTLRNSLTSMLSSGVGLLLTTYNVIPMKADLIAITHTAKDRA